MATEVLYRGGEEIIHHRATDADLYLILDGRVNVLTDDGDKITEVGPGSVVGEIAFHVTTLKFSAPELRKKMCGDKEFGFRILANLSRILCARMREAEDKLDTLMDHSHEAWNTWDK